MNGNIQIPIVHCHTSEKRSIVCAAKVHHQMSSFNYELCHTNELWETPKGGERLKWPKLKVFTGTTNNPTSKMVAKEGHPF